MKSLPEVPVIVAMTVRPPRQIFQSIELFWFNSSSEGTGNKHANEDSRPQCACHFPHGQARDRIFEVALPRNSTVSDWMVNMPLCPGPCARGAKEAPGPDRQGEASRSPIT